MEQHPIPQDVTGYKFRLVGDMTLTQFLELAGGIIMGVIFYSLPLPFFFKYPLAILSVGFGVGLAFVPIQGRPMGQWILAFIKSIYSPTIYVWKKQEKITPPKPQANASQPTQTVVQPSSIPPQPTSQPISPPNPTSQPPAQQLKTPGIKNSFFTPTTPNTISGMTLSPEGKILEGVVIELQKGDLTVRATKSNQLGQFIFAKPLENATYRIITEKDGFIFPKYALNLTGQVLSPLKLQATETIANQPPAHEQKSD